VRTDVQSFAVAHLLRRPAAHRVGPFVAGSDPATTSPYVNYATPVPGAEPTARDVAELIAAFRARGLKPRLECAPDAAPGVEPALRRAGFATEAEHEYLVRTPATLTVPHSSPEPAAEPKPGPEPMPRPRVRVEAPVAEADYIALDTAPAEAFGGAWAPFPEGAARLRRTAEGGGAVRLVRAPDGGCADGALCSAPAEGTAELNGRQNPARPPRPGRRGGGHREPRRGAVRPRRPVRVAGVLGRGFAPGVRTRGLPARRKPPVSDARRVTGHPPPSPGNGFSATNRRISSTATDRPAVPCPATRRDARDRSAHPGRNPAGGTARCRRRQTY